MPVTQAIEHLVGMQAQTPQSWYVGLWSRLQDYRAEDTSALLESREILRIALMRSTIHLATARDAWGLRPLMQPAFDRIFAGSYAKGVVGVD